MASESSSQIKRRSERRKAVAVDSGDEQESGGGIIAQSASHSSRHSSRSHKTARPIVINEFHGGVSINGNYAFGSERGDLPQPSPSLSPSRSTPPNSRIALSKRKKKILAQVEEIESYDTSDNSSRDSSPAPPSRKSQQLITPTKSQSDRTYPDEGYCTRGSSAKRGRAETLKSYSTRGLGRVPSDTSLKKPRPRRKQTNRHESDSNGGNVSVDEIHLAKEENEESEDDDSDDDFAKRTIKLEGPNKDEIEVRAILDTGTKPDWISSLFLERLNKKHSKLRDDQNKEYKDFNGKRFKASGTVDLEIMCDDFQGFKCRKKTFLVAKESAFQILLGRRTIKEERLLRLRPPDSSGEGAFPGIQTDISKAEQSKIVQNRAKQEREEAEQKRKREEKRLTAAKSKEKQNARPVPLASFAAESKTTRRRSRSRSRLPSQNGKGRGSGGVSSKASKLITKKKSSLSSLEGTW